MTTSLTYAQAGVDIEAGNTLVERIKPVAKATHRAGVMGGLGGFGALFDLRAAGYHDPILVGATDGVGTKLKIAIEAQKFDTIGIDLVAMCVNDLICQGAEPLFFLDYLATANLDVAQAEQIIAGIAQGCQQSGCALIGGETAEMPGMYAQGDFDLAGFAVGAMERGTALPRDVASGDVIIGLPSSGIHSNGFSLVRKIMAQTGLSWHSVAPFADQRLSDALMTPTRLYVRPCLEALKSGKIHGFAHITGGGLTENIPRVLPKGLGGEIDLSSFEMPPVFQWMQQAAHIKPHEMLKTFNCGVGMVAIVPATATDNVLDTFAQAGEAPFVLGNVTDTGKMIYHGTLQ